MIPTTWFQIEAEPPLIDDPYPKESWSIRVTRDKECGGISYFNSIEDAIETLKTEGYLT